MLVMRMLSVCAAALFTVSAHAGALMDFNLVVLGDLDGVTDVEGRTFVGGDLNANSSVYGTMLSQSDYNANPATLVVLGDLNPLTKQKEQYKVRGDLQYTGSIKNQNNEDVVSFQAFGGSQTAPTYTLADVTNQAKSLSDSLKALADTATLSIPNSPGPLNFTAGPGLTVYSVEDGNDIFSNSNVQQIDLSLDPDAENVIVNVGGEVIDFDMGNFVGGFVTNEGRSKVIWNFYEATMLDFDRSFDGMVLAPHATLVSQQIISGTVVVKNLNSRSEVHLPLTDIPSVVIPTPTAAAMGLAMVGLLVARRRR
ncbi:MAG: choice-of-anchor A family protein [Planctomycetota bacterium]